MNMQTQLQSLTFDEKIMAMEILWKEISSNPKDIASPEWHRQVLEEREGNETFIDWETAKEKIRESI